jgi:ATP-binding cassette subfamily C protein CydC
MTLLSDSPDRRRGSAAPAIERRLLRIAQPALGWMALAAALGVLTVISGVALMATSAYVISAAALQPSIAELQVAIVALRLFGISRGLLRYAERLAAHHATFHLLARLRLWFYAALEPLAPARLQRFQSGDLLARILSDIETLQDFFLRAISPPVVGLAVALLMSLVLTGVSPVLAALNLCLVGVGGVGLAWGAQRLTRSSGARLIEARGQLQTMLVESLQGMGDWLAYGLERGWIARVDALSEEVARGQARRGRVLALVLSGSSALGMLACLATIILLTPHVQAGDLPGVWLAAFALGMLASYEPAGALPTAAEQASSSRRAAGRLIQIVETVPEIDESAGAPLLQPFRSLRLEQVSFHYPGDPRPALSNVSLDLADGQRLGVLGSSGAGKSTVLHLLLRFWEVSHGRILVNDTDVRQLQPAAVRGLFACLLQPPYLFSDTLSRNVGLGNPDLAPDAIAHALELVALTERANAMPDGLDTWVGDFGAALSSGERQRLALARALARPAPILLLDEPTAGLDPTLASQVLDRLMSELHDRALILVTHDPTGLERMDEILILENGRIAARGTHAALADGDNLYRRMRSARRQEVILERLQRRMESEEAGPLEDPAS